MIHLITGAQGSGKTLYLVKIALQDYLAGKTIYSNVYLKHIKFKPIDYNDIIACKYENSTVIIDEAHILLPSRRAMSRINIEIVDKFISQVRKKGLQLYMTTQHQGKIDVRIRDEADYKYLCEKWAYQNGVWRQVAESINLSPEIPIKITVLAYQCSTGNTLPLSFSGNEYFKYFDTSQIVDVRGINI